MGHSVLKAKEAFLKKDEENKEELVSDLQLTFEDNDKVMLFTTTTCPNCSLAEKILKEKGISFEKVLSNDHLDLVDKYDVMAAPTLVIDKGENVIKASGINEVENLLNH